MKQVPSVRTPGVECDKMVMLPHAVSGRDWEGGAAVGSGAAAPQAVSAMALLCLP